MGTGVEGGRPAADEVDPGGPAAGQVDGGSPGADGAEREAKPDAAPARRWPRAEVAVLILVVLASVGARSLFLDQPCHSPCRTSADHGLIFDEIYYVDAARTILGIPVPAGQKYAGAPAGHDPNAEHPPLAKLIMAGTMEVFGDDPVGWRIGSVVFGTVALLLLYELVRSTGGSRWLGVGATALMAADNLSMVHGRIATLDVYAVTFMLGAAVLYVRRRPLLAGVALGLGADAKEVAGYLVVILVIWEALQWWMAGREPGRTWVAPVRRLAVCGAAAAAVFVVALWLLDLVARPMADGHAVGGPFSHIHYMLTYALHETSPNGPTGTASYPWQWLVGAKPLNYYTTVVNTLVNGKVVATRAVIAFRGAINPFILMLTIPALFVSAEGVWRRRSAADALALSWFLGIYPLFLLQSGLQQRTTYVYYMVIVLPAVYVSVARLFSAERLPRAARVGLAVAVVVGLIQLYPFRTLTGL